MTLGREQSRVSTNKISLRPTKAEWRRGYAGFSQPTLERIALLQYVWYREWATIEIQEVSFSVPLPGLGWKASRFNTRNDWRLFIGQLDSAADANNKKIHTHKHMQPHPEREREREREGGGGEGRGRLYRGFFEADCHTVEIAIR